MAHETLKATIRQYIGPNGQNSITGQIMQDILIAMVDEYPNLSGYATQSWVNTQLGGYLPLTGGNLNGNLSIYDTMNIYSSSIEWNDDGDYSRIAFDDDGITVTAHGTGYVIANEFIKNGGTSSQFLKADGSVDSNTYITSASLSGYATQSWVNTQLANYLPLTGGNIDGNLSIYDTMNIYSSSIEWNDNGDYCHIAFDDDGITVAAHGTGYVIANEFIKNGGTSSQFLKADGSVDGNSYLLSSGGTITGNLTVDDILIASSGNLHIFGASGGGNAVVFEVQNILDVMFNGGSEYFFDAQITAPAFNNTSDLRKKTITGDVLMNLYNVANAPLFKFTWKDEKKYSGEHIGSAAQYWQTVLPELVSIGRDVDMTLAMQYDVIALASAITVAKTVVDHEARIRQLEEKIK